MTEQGVYLRHLSVEIVKDLSDRAIRGQGRGLGPWSPSLGLSKAEYNREIRSEEDAPTPALGNLDEQPDARSPLQQFAGASDAQAQPIGNSLWAKQGLEEGKREEAGKSSWPVFGDNGALCVTIDALEIVQALETCSCGRLERIENPEPIGLLRSLAKAKSLHPAGEAGEGSRAGSRVT
jgi:hypothetical protein